MSGHSKWASIKHKKGAADAKRASTFTRLANDVSVAAKRGGGDPGMNPMLRMAVDRARAANMPKDNIERAIKRGTGELGGSATEELLYEGFGPGNVAILVGVLTDNRNRSSADIRLLFSKNGGRFAEGGGVAYQFTQQGVVRCAVSPAQELGFEEACIEGGASDYQLGDGYGVAYAELADLNSLREALEASGCGIESAGPEYVARSPIEVTDADMEVVVTLVSALEDYDDVTAVYTNLAE